MIDVACNLNRGTNTASYPARSEPKPSSRPMRRVFQLLVQGSTFVGTQQIPENMHACSPGAKGPSVTVAVLFLSFGQTPRAGLSDVEVFLADRLTEHGYMTLRVDSPGLGDAPGDLPEDIRTFWRDVEAGHQQALMREFISKVTQTFALDGVIVAGLCAGAINAAYTADPPHADVRGLVLIELPLIGTPPLHRPRMGPDSPPPPVPGSGLAERTRQALYSARFRIREVTKNNPVGKRLRAAAASVCAFINRLAGGNLAQNANRRLIKALQHISDRTMPVLLFCTDAVKGEVALQAVLRRNRSCSIRCVHLDGTNHMLNTIAGKQNAAEQIGFWLREQFPLVDDRP
jgi:pimeloyl-ACP methyl ester carboxylesterase